MLYVRFFLRCLAVGGLAAFLPSVVYELLKSRNGNADSKELSQDFQSMKISIGKDICSFKKFLSYLTDGI